MSSSQDTWQGMEYSKSQTYKYGRCKCGHIFMISDNTDTLACTCGRTMVKKGGKWKLISSNGVSGLFK